MRSPPPRQAGGKRQPPPGGRAAARFRRGRPRSLQRGCWGQLRRPPRTSDSGCRLFAAAPGARSAAAWRIPSSNAGLGTMPGHCLLSHGRFDAGHRKPHSVRRRCHVHQHRAAFLHHCQVAARRHPHTFGAARGDSNRHRRLFAHRAAAGAEGWPTRLRLYGAAGRSSAHSGAMNSSLRPAAQALLRSPPPMVEWLRPGSRCPESQTRLIRRTALRCCGRGRRRTANPCGRSR